VQMRGYADVQVILLIKQKMQMLITSAHLLICTFAHYFLTFRIPV
jgi:hypothetical protein